MVIENIAILITCHNRKEITISCLKKLYNCSIPDGYFFEVFLVDDGCTDGTSEEVKANFPDINIIQGDGNLYWNRGMNLAWSVASNKDFSYYIWLNDDTLLYENALTQVLENSKIKLDKAIICGTTCSKYNEKEVTYGGQKLKIGFLKPTGEMQNCEFFNGNFVLVPNYVFAIVGNLDPIFHHSVGDIDYGIRAKRNGIDIFTTNGFIGTCEVHESIPKWYSPEINIFERLIYLYSPLGCNPFQFFVFDYRQNGLTLAILHFFSIHYWAVFPNFKKNNR